MPREKPSSPGGKLIAAEILAAIQANISDMKLNGGNRKAEQNELIGNEDLANIIAIAVEKAMGNLVTIGPPNESALANTGGPVIGATKLSVGVPYVFK